MIFADVDLKVMCSSNKESLGDMSGLPYYIAGGCFSDLPDEDGSGRAESALCYIFSKNTCILRQSVVSSQLRL